MRVYSSRRWDFPSLSFSSSIVLWFPLFLVALHPHLTLVSSLPSCSLWCSFNFPLLVYFLVFASTPESSTTTKPPHTSDLQLMPHHWKWAVALRFMVAPHCSPSSSGGVEFRRLPDTFGIKKYQCLINKLHASVWGKQMSGYLRTRKLNLFGQISNMQLTACANGTHKK